jgi:hypothetical protein
MSATVAYLKNWYFYRIEVIPEQDSNGGEDDEEIDRPSFNVIKLFFFVADDEAK